MYFSASQSWSQRNAYDRLNTRRVDLILDESNANTQDAKVEEDLTQRHGANASTGSDDDFDQNVRPTFSAKIFGPNRVYTHKALTWFRLM